MRIERPDAEGCCDWVLEMTTDEASQLAWLLRFGKLNDAPFVAGVVDHAAAQKAMETMGRELIRAGVPLRPWFMNGEPA